MKIIMTRGLPASGKSTWARDLVSRDGSYVRVNKDDLRDMLHDGKWSGKREKEVLAVRDAIIIAALDRGQNVIVDDTNLHPKHVQRINEIAMAHGKVDAVEIKDFNTNVDECVKRDAERAKPVGEKVIRGMYRDFVLSKPEPQDTSLPPAIIVDIDGTLALMGDRSPYEDQLAYLDAPNEPIIDIVNDYANDPNGHVLIVMSGRDEGRSRTVTEKWLLDNGVWFAHLYMRPAGDTRKDSIVKKELFNKHVRGKYHVKLVFDDRDQVVRMWREELGLTCLQVAPGDF